MRDGEPHPGSARSSSEPHLARPISSTAEDPPAGASPQWEVSGLIERSTRGPLERLGLGSIGSYVLIEELARGGMGVVYRALHPELQRHVAIKVLHAAERASGHQLARFQTEAQAAARLRHPAIVRVHDVGRHSGCPYIVMDLIEGRSLQGVIDEEGPLPERRAAEITRTLAEALHLAHREGVLHRDVKPHNVLISAESGAPYLTDFGLAKEVDSKQGLTKTGQFMGTPGYCAPEQMRGQTDQTDGRADQYGLGATLYAMLTGRAPIVGDTAVQTIVQMMEGAVRPPRQRRPDLSRDLETICLKCLETDPERRYADAGALAVDLTRFLNDEPIDARRASTVERLRRWSRRNRGLARALVGGALILMTVGFAGATWLARRASDGALQRAADEATALAQQLARAAREADERILGVLRDCEARSLTPGELDRLVASLSSGATPTTAPLLARELGRTTQEVLLPAERAIALAVKEPTAVERRAGERTLTHLDEALRARADNPPGHRLAKPLRAALRSAWRRTRQRAIQRKGEKRDVPTRNYARRAIATRQTQLLGPHGAQRLAVIVRALEAIGRREPAVEALGRYLQFEADEGRAQIAAKALCRLGGPAAQRHVFRALERFSEASFTRALKQRLTLLEGTPIDEEDPVQRAGRARIRLARDDPTGALADLDRAVALAPDDPALWNARGDLQRGDLRWARAERDFGRAIALAPDQAPLYTRRADARRQLRRFRQAAVDIEKALELDPYLVDAWISKAMLLMAQSRPRDALELLRRAVRLDPLEPEAWYQLGRARKALREYAAAVQAYDRAIALDPFFAKAWRNRGSARRRLLDFKGATADLKRALELDPANPWAHIYYGNLLARTGDLEGAVTAYRQALAIRDSLARAWQDMATALVQLGRLAEAQRAAAKAVVLAPEAPGGWVVKGDVARLRRRFERAEEAYTKALELDPKYAVALGNRALARLSRGDSEGALRDADAALALEPDSRAGLNNRALIHKARKDWKAAERDLELALRLDRKFAPAYVARADLYLKTQRTARALEDLTKATRLEPTLREAWMHRAALLRALGRYAEAHKDATKAIELDASRPLPYAIRGLVRASLKDRRGAVEDLERFLKLAPADHRDRAEVEARLAELKR